MTRARGDCVPSFRRSPHMRRAGRGGAGRCSELCVLNTNERNEFAALWCLPASSLFPASRKPLSSESPTLGLESIT